MKATVDEVEKHPGEYLHRVMEGETVVVFRDDRPVAEIRPLNAAVGPRPIGLAAGEFVVPDGFDDPLPDDVLDLFEGLGRSAQVSSDELVALNRSPRQNPSCAFHQDDRAVPILLLEQRWKRASACPRST